MSGARELCFVYTFFFGLVYVVYNLGTFYGTFNIITYKRKNLKCWGARVRVEPFGENNVIIWDHEEILKC